MQNFSSILKFEESELTKIISGNKTEISYSPKSFSKRS